MTTALILLRDWQESQIEFWRPLAGFPGYDVSTMGRIRSYWQRVTGMGRGTRAMGQYPSFLTLFPIKSTRSVGYLRVYLFRGGQRFCYFVHRLVAQAFLENPEGLPEVNHITGIKGDNRVDGLEWSTRSNNQLHAHRIGLIKMPAGVYWNTPNRKTLTVDQVRDIRRRSVQGELSRSIARDYNTRTFNINRIVKRERWAFVE